jgi:predicted nucleic acid-binding protein
VNVRFVFRLEYPKRPGGVTARGSLAPGPRDKERGRICRKAADYMLPREALTSPIDPERAGTPAAIAGLQPHPVVLDTNTVLDWLVFDDASARTVGLAIGRGQMRWLVTPCMLRELRSVLARPLPERWERSRELALTFDVEGLAVVCAEPAIGPHLRCRDAADQVFIDLAREHSPALLLTRDRALLELRRRAGAVGVLVETASAWLATRPDMAGAPSDGR